MDDDHFLAHYVLENGYQAPEGSQLHTCNWQVEAILRVYLNSLNEKVSGRLCPLSLVDKSDVANVVKRLLTLKPNETLVLEEGKELLHFPTNRRTARMLISQTVSKRFSEAMLTGHWIDSGFNGRLQFFYRVFEWISTRFGGSLGRKWTVIGGAGREGCALASAVKLLGGVCLIVDSDDRQLSTALQNGYLDMVTDDQAEAHRMALEAKMRAIPRAIGLASGIAPALQQLITSRTHVDVAVDLTPCNFPIHRYIPTGYSPSSAPFFRQRNPKAYLSASLHTIAWQAEMLTALQEMGTLVFECGNGLIEKAEIGGCRQLSELTKTTKEVLYTVNTSITSPHLWIALSGKQEDITIFEKAVRSILPEDSSSMRWLRISASLPIRGLPSLSLWLDISQRDSALAVVHQLLCEKRLSAPIALLHSGHNEEACLVSAPTESSPTPWMASLYVPCCINKQIDTI